MAAYKYTAIAATPLLKVQLAFTVQVGHPLKQLVAMGTQVL